MKLKKWFKIWGFTLTIGVFFVIIIINSFQEQYKNNCLKKTKLTIGTINEITFGSVRHPKSAEIIYNIKDKKYNFWERGDFTKLKVGDTVIIEYSLKDESVARVRDKNYNKNNIKTLH
ncbi:MAG: hypothetical protein LW701_10275 [Fluviicola sp.]|jgi:hypothetical protein|nr:hypothetical protein [Fluviicola sp.]